MAASGPNGWENMEALQRENDELRARIAELLPAGCDGDHGALRLAAIVESSDDAIVGKTLDGVVESWNAGAERIYGYPADEMIGRPMMLLLPPDRSGEEDQILERIRGGNRVDHFETVRVRKDGRHVNVSLTISPIRNREGRIVGASHIARDVTERKAFEQQLRQAQKLESLGVLAGGIAHDFNNLLTGILGNASLALDSIPPANPNRKLLLDVVKAGETAAELTRQLLAYAGRGRFVTALVSLSDLVREIGGLIQTSIPRTVQVRFHLADRLPPFEADAGQIQQVVMNLVINGAEAIGDGKNGAVLVTTHSQEVDEHYARTVWGGQDLQTGCYVALEVHDTGCGMDEATVARIFDPFFTTKFTGRGLGLAAVLGIVRGHKGSLKVYSAAGRGSTFKVLFPARETGKRCDAPQPNLLQLHGTETILVVDDEDIVRGTARNALQMYGYTVLTARDGREAIEVFSQQRDSIDLVLLDLTMPVMGGEEALRNLTTLKPGVKVLLSSGFNEVEAVRRFTGKSLAGFIQKPYAALQLLERVRGALN